VPSKEEAVDAITPRNEPRRCSEKHHLERECESAQGRTVSPKDHVAITQELPL
jgi:hypothetical protein